MYTIYDILFRYSYVHNNPIKHKDPSGHYIDFGDPDDNAISRIKNAHQKANKPITWSQAETKHLSKVSKVRKKAYTDTSKTSAQRAKEANEKYIKDSMAKWEGDAGYIGKRRFESALESGLSIEDAYRLALSVKKYCDDLSTEHLSNLRKKVEAIEDSDLTDYFQEHGSYFTTYDRDPVSGNTVKNTRWVWYSAFWKDINSTVPATESFKKGGEALFKASLVVGVGALLDAAMGYGALAIGQQIVNTGLTLKLIYHALRGDYTSYSNLYFSDVWTQIIGSTNKVRKLSPLTILNSPINLMIQNMSINHLTEDGQIRV